MPELQLPKAPNFLKMLRDPAGIVGTPAEPEQDDGRMQRIVGNITATMPQTAANPSESQVLQDRLNTLDAPISRKDALLKAVEAFAPTAIAGLAGGLPAAAGAAQGTAQEFNTERALHEKQREDLLKQVETARAREMQSEQFAQNLGLHREDTAAANQRNQATIAAAGERNKATIDAGNQRNATNLRKLGLDPEGNPIPREQLTLAEQSKLDVSDALEELRKAQAEHATAQAEFERTRNDPNSPAFRMAQQRLNMAQSRLDLSRQQTESRLFGTNQGVPLPGALLEPGSDRPVGSSYSQNVRPTGQERNKGDMAISAREQLEDIKAIVQRHPEIFGPGHGQISEIRQWSGTQDPDAQRFVAARTIAGDHLAGTFGGRSEAALNALDAAIGHFKDNPKAMEAGLDQLLKANQIFEKQGTVRTTGSAPPAVIGYGPPENRTLKNGEKVRVHKNLKTGAYEEF